MNILGVDVLQLIIYVCVAASLITVIYILKLTRTKTKPRTEQKPSEQTQEQTIKQLIALIDKMWSHQVGLTSCSQTSNPESKRQKRTKPPPEPPHSILKIDEETFVPTEKDKVVLEAIKKQLGSEQ